jgi:hypothetical protein
MQGVRKYESVFFDWLKIETKFYFALLIKFYY